MTHVIETVDAAAGNEALAQAQVTAVAAAAEAAEQLAAEEAARVAFELARLAVIRRTRSSVVRARRAPLTLALQRDIFVRNAFRDLPEQPVAAPVEDSPSTEG